MKWVSVDEYLPPIGLDVFGFRPAALKPAPASGPPIMMVYRQPNGCFSGAHQVTQWLDMDMPDGWTAQHEKRQHQ